MGDRRFEKVWKITNPALIRTPSPIQIFSSQSFLRTLQKIIQNQNNAVPQKYRTKIRLRPHS